MLTVINGVTGKKILADEVIAILNTMNLDGYFYLGYPILGGMDGKIKVDALLVCRQYGLVIFDLEMSSEEDIENKTSFLDELYNNMESRLKRHSYLSKKRKLQIPINIVSYAPRYKTSVEEICISKEQLEDYLKMLSWDQSDDYYEKLLEAIQMISQIKKRGLRTNLQKDNSKGAKLKAIENQISCLDKYQSKAVIETVNGVQRIRGLAGSGKTIVLALKVAYLYTMYEEKVIAVTFNSRALKGQFIQLISNFIIENTNEKPDWNRIKIIHAWGSKNEEGLYFNFCKANNLVCYDYMDACRKFGRDSFAFDKVCQEAVEMVSDPEVLYDAILVDEAQDFSKCFLQMCYMSLPKEKRMLVYAYDELQSLDNKNVDSPEEIFGYTNGKPNVVLDNSNGKAEDIVLSKCYRNSRPILITAHSLGLGIYREKENRETTPLVQLFEDKKLWEDIGYAVKEGAIVDGESVTLYRTEKTSPLFLESHSAIDDLIRFEKFDSIDQEAKWVVEDIEKNLKEEELKYQDIMIIHPEPKTTKSYVSQIRVMLMEKGIKSHIVGVQTTPDDFFQEDSIAVSQIYRAKGNEAAVVYLVNADVCAKGINLSRKRNILFTALTRSKAWVRVSGLGENMKLLIDEYTKVKERNFELQFKYPNELQRQNMRIIHRDMTQNEIRDIKKSNNSLVEIVSKIQKGEIQKEDLDEKTIEMLKDVLLN
ncbi:DEAD/DEAH box helicase [Ruminococcus sp. 5_1_39BFAA]|uniref:DEAD/DEAH box helicase n=1 Tax=Ruminococcus sp. 5_1_39BFAA TaxID=457412 RepID=UPI003561F1C7